MEPEPARVDETADLLGELQHRVRNTLAAMRAIVRRSAETSESLEDYVMHLEGRLDAMARVQTAFIRNPLGGIDLHLLVADELAACHAREGERVTLDGPPIQLHPRAAETIGLALHELATNALKWGALTSPAGRIAVTWRIEDRANGPHLCFTWVESGVPHEGEAPRRGFGFIVLEEMMAHSLKAETRLSLPTSGLVYRVDMALTPRLVVQA